MDIDKWTAEKCGITFYQNGDTLFYGDIDAVNAMNNGEIVVLDRADVCRSLNIWTMQDARCREIVREHFNIDTISGDGDWSCLAECGAQGIGDTIENAEINCIHELIAIMEADNENQR